MFLVVVSMICLLLWPADHFTVGHRQAFRLSNGPEKRMWVKEMGNVSRISRRDKGNAFVGEVPECRRTHRPPCAGRCKTYTMVLTRSLGTFGGPTTKSYGSLVGVLAGQTFRGRVTDHDPITAGRRCIAARHDTTLTPPGVQRPATAGNRETREFPK